MPSLSIFFPAYNDAGTIASLALVAHMTARELTSDYEVIVVEDGSPDHTGALLDEMARHFPWLKVVHHEKNRGYGGRACGAASPPPRRTSSSTPTGTPSTTRGK